MDRIVIFDTTLRDGEQSPGFSMNVEEKLKMARQLERLQVDVIEAGFPIASEGDFEAVKRTAFLFTWSIRRSNKPRSRPLRRFEKSVMPMRFAKPWRNSKSLRAPARI